MRKFKKKYKDSFVRIGVVAVLAVSICVGIMFILGQNDDTNQPGFNNHYIKVNQLTDEDKQRLDTAIEVKTQYLSLYFPKDYEDYLEVKYTQDIGYKAEFYGKVKDKRAVHLFDICFNSDDGDLLGYLDINKEIVNMSYDVKVLEFDKKWKQEEKDIMYSMQEEVNFVLAVLGTNEYYVEP